MKCLKVVIITIATKKMTWKDTERGNIEGSVRFYAVPPIKPVQTSKLSIKTLVQTLKSVHAASIRFNWHKLVQ